MFKTSLLAVVAALVVSHADGYTDEALADQIKNLPGTENLNVKFNQFSGTSYIVRFCFL